MDSAIAKATTTAKTVQSAIVITSGLASVGKAGIGGIIIINPMTTGIIVITGGTIIAGIVGAHAGKQLIRRYNKRVDQKSQEDPESKS